MNAVTLLANSGLGEHTLWNPTLKGVLVVAAAGNNSSDNDLVPYFPASYELTNILSVAAIGPHLNLIQSSNFGEHSVDISAPGENVLSFLPMQSLGTMTGTSQATAVATGAIANWLGQRGSTLSPFVTIEQIKATGENLNCKYCDPSKLKPKLNLARLVKMSHELRSESPSIEALDSLEINTETLALDLP